MKGISAVIATILMLMITIAMAGMAYLYISGYWKSKTSVSIALDEQTTTCTGAFVITPYVRNDGTNSITLDQIFVDGTKADGTAITGAVCGLVASQTGTGQSVACATVTGSRGSNQIKVHLGTTAATPVVSTGTVYCA